MPIIDERYTATIETKIPCLVRCLKCNCQFVYERLFSGSGVAHTSWPNDQKRTRQAAEQAARRDLAEMLADIEICDPVPCPECFCYQPYMFSQVAYGRYDNLGCVSYSFLFLGTALLAGAIVSFVVIRRLSVIVYGLAAGALLTLFVGTMLFRRLETLTARYDPNEDATKEKREHIAAARALRLNGFDEQQAVRARDAYARRAMGDTPRRTDGKENPFEADALVEWWLPPEVFLKGGTVSFRVTENDHVTLVVPENLKPGAVLGLRLYPQGVVPFAVRMLAMRVHPDEHRDE